MVKMRSVFIDDVGVAGPLGPGERGGVVVAIAVAWVGAAGEQHGDGAAVAVAGGGTWKAVSTYATHPEALNPMTHYGAGAAI